MRLISFLYLLATLCCLALTVFVITTNLDRDLLFGGLFFVAVLCGGACSWFLSADIGLWSVSARPYDGTYLDWIGSELSKFGLETPPKVWLFPSTQINAFVLGRSRKLSHIVLSSALLEQQDDVIKSVLFDALVSVTQSGRRALIFGEGIINVFTIFPTRMISLLIGTSLRTSEEDTPSDWVENILKAVFELVFVPHLSLLSRSYARYLESDRDQALSRLLGAKKWANCLSRIPMPSSNFPTREMFSAPFSFTARVRSGMRLVSHHNPLNLRANRVNNGLAT